MHCRQLDRPDLFFSAAPAVASSRLGSASSPLDRRCLFHIPYRESSASYVVRHSLLLGGFVTRMTESLNVSRIVAVLEIPSANLMVRLGRSRLPAMLTAVRLRVLGNLSVEGLERPSSSFSQLLGRLPLGHRMKGATG